MKRTIMIVMALAATSAFAVPPHPGTNAVDVVAATSNYVEKVRMRIADTNTVPCRMGLMIPPFVKTNASALAQIDAALVSRPPIAVLFSDNYEELLPRTFVAAKAYYANSKPHLVQFMSGPAARRSMSKAEIAAARIEAFVVFTDKYLDMKRNRMGRALSPLIVPALRKAGKAVTTGPDGISPVKVFADRISRALNAPGFGEINTILEELGVPARIDMAACGMPSVEEAEEIASKIMAGELDFTPDIGGKLSAALGVEGYNAFIERYNGGTR